MSYNPVTKHISTPLRKTSPQITPCQNTRALKWCANIGKTSTACGLRPRTHRHHQRTCYLSGPNPRTLCHRRPPLWHHGNSPPEPATLVSPQHNPARDMGEQTHTSPFPSIRLGNLCLYQRGRSGTTSRRIRPLYL